MVKKRVAIVGTIAVALSLVLAGVLVYSGQPEDMLPPDPVPGNSSATNLGFTYLPVTRQVATYYGLGIDSGALVTDVIPDSPADQAGVEVGDVILSFNGAELEDGVPLLGMMMACSAGNRITLGITRGEKAGIIELIHTAG